jgi:hypothetical protein
VVCVHRGTAAFRKCTQSTPACPSQQVHSPGMRRQHTWRQAMHVHCAARAMHDRARHYNVQSRQPEHEQYKRVQSSQSTCPTRCIIQAVPHPCSACTWHYNSTHKRGSDLRRHLHGVGHPPYPPHHALVCQGHHRQLLHNGHPQHHLQPAVQRQQVSASTCARVSRAATPALMTAPGSSCKQQRCAHFNEDSVSVNYMLTCLSSAAASADSVQHPACMAPATQRTYESTHMAAAASLDSTTTLQRPLC